MHILVVDDELSMREYLEVLLARAGYEVTCAGAVAAAREVLGRAGGPGRLRHEAGQGRAAWTC